MNWRFGIIGWKHGGGEWPAEFDFRCDPDGELQSHLMTMLGSPKGANVRILDVGAGPLTVLGKKWPGRNVEIIPTDALSEGYDELLQKHGIVPLIRTIPVKGEELDVRFPADYFDLVHAQNCIDHCEHPLKVIENMLKVARPNAFVLLYHAVREGAKEGYEGLHQWDFYSRDNAFFIDGMGETVNVSHCLEKMAEVTCHEANDWLRVTIRKR